MKIKTEIFNVKPPVNICPHCGADLFEVGVTEAVLGGYAETKVDFKNGKANIGKTNIQDIDDEWALCCNCGKIIDYIVSDIIEAFEETHPQEAID